jgi:nucleolar protein 14
MRGDDDEDGDDGGGGGFAARRKRQQQRMASGAPGVALATSARLQEPLRASCDRRLTCPHTRALNHLIRPPPGDALDDDFDLSDEDEGEEDEGEEGDEGGDAGDPLSALDARRRARAGGDHPLQAAFREQAARLAAKYGVEVAGGSGSGSEDEGEEGEDEDEEGEEEGESGSGEGEEDGGSGGEEEEDEEAGGSSSGSEEEEADAAAARQRAGKDAAAAPPKARSGAAAAPPPLEGPLDLPFTIPVPQRYEAFAALVGGRPPEELALAISRIRAFNAAALATDNKRQLQVRCGARPGGVGASAGPLGWDH